MLASFFKSLPAPSFEHHNNQKQQFIKTTIA
jgi:hypothetical protein